MPWCDEFGVLFVPRKHRGLDEAVLCLVCIENREVSFSKCLLGRYDGRIVEYEPEEIYGQRRYILKSDADSGPAS